MIGGYKLIDCSGLDLLADSKQTITGIYAKVEEAYKTGKPIIAQNLEWGDVGIMSPVAVMVLPYAENTYTATASTLQLVITSDDGVVVNNFIQS